MVPSLAMVLLATIPVTPLDDVMAAYDQFEFERTASLAESLVKQGDITNTVKAQALVYLGLATFTLGQREHASTAFAAALAIDATLNLPKDTSPKILEAFETQRRARASVQEVEAPVASTVVPELPTHSDVPVAASVVTSGPLWHRHAVWGTGIASGVALASGVVLGFISREARSDFRQADDVAKARQLSRRAHDTGLWANVMFGVGATLGVSTAVLFVLPQ